MGRNTYFSRCRQAGWKASPYCPPRFEICSNKEPRNAIRKKRVTSFEKAIDAAELEAEEDAKKLVKAFRSRMKYAFQKVQLGRKRFQIRAREP